MTRSQSLIGFYLPVFYSRPDLIARALQFLAEALTAGGIVSVVDRVLPLREAAQAHRLLESHSVQGVIVLDPSA